MNYDTFKDRLKLVMGSDSNRSFGDKCGLSEGTVRRYLKGDAFPPLDTLQVIADAGGCGLGWLASGEGEMKRGEMLYVDPTVVHGEPGLALIVEWMNYNYSTATPAEWELFKMSFIRNYPKYTEWLENKEQEMHMTLRR